MENLTISSELEAKAGDAILQRIIDHVPEYDGYDAILGMAEAYALVRGTGIGSGVEK